MINLLLSKKNKMHIFLISKIQYFALRICCQNHKQIFREYLFIIFVQVQMHELHNHRAGPCFTRRELVKTKFFPPVLVLLSHVLHCNNSKHRKKSKKVKRKQNAKNINIRKHQNMWDEFFFKFKINYKLFFFI